MNEVRENVGEDCGRSMPGRAQSKCEAQRWAALGMLAEESESQVPRVREAERVRREVEGAQ